MSICCVWSAVKETSLLQLCSNSPRLLAARWWWSWVLPDTQQLGSILRGFLCLVVCPVWWVSLLASSGTRGEPHLPHGPYEETWCQNISGSAGPGLARGLQAPETGTCEGHDLQAPFQVNRWISVVTGAARGLRGALCSQLFPFPVHLLRFTITTVFWGLHQSSVGPNGTTPCVGMARG